MKSKRNLWIILSLLMILMICPVTVQAKVALNKKSLSINVNKTYKLKLKGTKKKVKWSSSNKKIATVSSKGVVKGKKAGTCKIYAKLGKKKYTCKVKVKTPKTPSTDSVVLSKNNVSLNVGETESVLLNCLKDVKEVNYSVDKAGIVNLYFGKWTRDADATHDFIYLNLTGRSAGTCNITISNTTNSQTDVITVTVTDKYDVSIECNTPVDQGHDLVEFTITNHGSKPVFFGSFGSIPAIYIKATNVLAGSQSSQSNKTGYFHLSGGMIEPGRSGKWTFTDLYQETAGSTSYETWQLTSASSFEFTLYTLSEKDAFEEHKETVYVK